MLKQLVAGIVAFVMLAGVAVAGPFEDGVAAYDRGDYETALRLWRPLAEQGHADAQTNLGVLFAEGQGVPQDYAEAVRLYRLAAEQGNASALFNLGLKYRDGQGVPQDYAEAARWFRLAAEQGHAFAQLNLGALYAEGEGVPKDYVLAHLWWNLAAAQGDERAKENRDILASRMTPDQLAEAQRMAREWKPAAER